MAHHKDCILKDTEDTILMMGYNVFSQILTPLTLLFLIENYYEVGMKYFSDG